MKFIYYAFAVVLAPACFVHLVQAQTTGFIYQGALSDENGAANGLFDMTFGLFTADTGGDALATVTNTSVSVSNGLFTTTLDFGAAVFDGADYWLEIGVRTDGRGSYTTLFPQQPLTAVPYALRARMAVDVVNPMILRTISDPPLMFYVNNARGFQLQPTTNEYIVNLIGGSDMNEVAENVISATLAGGGKGGTIEYDESSGPNFVRAHYCAPNGVRGAGRLLNI